MLAPGRGGRLMHRLIESVFIAGDEERAER
jgi:hypothetical protein